MEFFFCVFANDVNKPLDLLDVERKGIESAVHPLVSRNEAQYYVMYDENMDDLLQSIRKYRNQITWFHFSGHHNKGLGLQLNDGNFSELLNNLAKCPNLKGVFINGCSSEDTTKTFSGSIPIYIGTSKPIYDGVAVKMSLEFYEDLETLDKWNNFDQIHESYITAAGNITNLLAENTIKGTSRGGGTVEDFKRDFYLISEKSDNNNLLFDNRKALYFKHKIDNTNPNKELESVIRRLALKGEVKKYPEQVPYIFHKFIKALDAPGKFVGKYKKNRQYGLERCELIRSYFLSYLDLCRFSIFSILWDEITKQEIEIPMEEILSLLIPNDEYSKKNIKILQNLCNTIILKHGTKYEKSFVELLMPSFKTLKEGVQFYSNQYRDNSKDYEIFYRSEQLLYNILEDSKFLNHYHIRSVYSKYYFKHRDSEPQFVVEHLDRKRPQTDSEDILGFELINVHSVYLCQKEGPGQGVINLSPFYFDKNADFPHAQKIDLYVLDQVEKEYGDFEFEYLPISDPSIRDSDDDSRLIVNQYGIDDSTSDFNNAPLAKSIRESKRLYDQLSHFVNLFTQN